MGLTGQIFKIPSSVQHKATKKRWKEHELTKLSPYEYFDFILKTQH